MQEMHPQRTGDFLYLYMYQPQLERINLERVLEPLTEKTQSHRALDNLSFCSPTEGGMLCIKPPEPGGPL